MYPLKGFLTLLLMWSWGVSGAQELPVIFTEKGPVKVFADEVLLFEWKYGDGGVRVLPRKADSSRIRLVAESDGLSLTFAPDSSGNITVTDGKRKSSVLVLRALPEPVMWQLHFGFSLLMVIILVGYTAWIRWEIMKTENLLLAGVFSVLVFWGLYIFTGFLPLQPDVYPDAEVLQQYLEREAFITLILIFAAILSAFFVAGIIKAGRKAGISLPGALLNAALPVCFLWAAAFPSGHTWHRWLLCFLPFISLSPLFVLKRQAFGKRGVFPVMGLLSALMMLTGGAGLFSGKESQIVRHAELLFHAGWSLWFLASALLLMPQKQTFSETKFCNI